MRTVAISKPPPKSMASALLEIDFVSEHRKQLARLALFDNVIIQKEGLRVANTKLEQKRPHVNGLKMRVQDLRYEVSEIHHKHDEMKQKTFAL